MPSGWQPCKNGVCRVAVARYTCASLTGNYSMTAEVLPSGRFVHESASDGSRRRLAIGFMNWAHALDHFVILIYPTVVIELAVIYGRTYASLIALATASFVAFGLFSLPAGWLAARAGPP